MNARRAYLKELAAQSVHLWSGETPPGCLVGTLGLETRHSTYTLEDGEVTSMRSNDEVSHCRAHPASFLGMRVVGWLLAESPERGVVADWKPEAYAVLWRPQRGTTRSAIAVTSATVALHRAARATQATQAIRATRAA